MKHINKSWLYKVCNLCIAFAGIMHWTKMSLWLFGEQPYPEKTSELPYLCPRFS